MALRPRVAVLGAGLSGLSLAHFVRKELGPAARITLYEASNRVGGHVESIRFPSRQSGRSYLFERGCRGLSKSGNSLFVFQLIQDLHLEDEVIFIAPSASKRYIRLPNGQMWPIPNSLRSLLFSPLASGCVSALFRDRFRSSPSQVEDESVDEFFRERFGDHIVEHLIDPVLSGTYGSDLCDMSMAATFPLWYPLMHDTSSVMAAMSKGTMDAFDASTKEVLPSEFIQMGMSSPGISFVSGTQVLVDTLHEELSAQDNTEVLMNAPVTAVEPCGDTTLVTAAGGSPEEYTHVFSTLAAPDLSDVLPNSCSVARSKLSEIDHSSFWVVNLGYSEPLIAHRGVGYFTPSTSGSPAMRVLFDSTLFPQQAAGPDTRVSVTLGRHATQDLRGKSIEEIANLAADTVASHLHVPELAVPDAADAVFASRAYPVSPVGHPSRMAAVRADVAEQLPGLHVLGAGYDGPDASFCVASAFHAAKELGRKHRLATHQGAPADADGTPEADCSEASDANRRE